MALWAMRVILPAPDSTFPYAAELDKYETPLVEHNEWRFTPIEQQDQQFVASVVAHHARTLLSAPWRLFDTGQCYPMPKAITLGEHMFGAALLAVVPYALTRDPIVTYNTVVILALWLPALAMYALVYHWTRNVGAAFVSGLLFAFHPDRVFYPAHPFIHGNQWTPLALLFAHRLFTRRGWWDAAGLALFVGLQILESPYQLLAFAILGGIYGSHLVLHNLRLLPSLAPKLLAVGGVTAAIAAAVFGPYLHTRATWPGLLRSQDALYPLSLHELADFGVGGGAYTGSVALLLVAIGLLDRLRGARGSRGDDPRLALATAGLLVAWTVVEGVRIPLLNVFLPSPLVLARGIVPGLDALRVPVLARLGVHLVAAFLAGYGLLALVEGRRTVTRHAITAVFAGAAFAEVFYPAAAVHAFRHSVAMKAYSVRPPADVVQLYGHVPHGAVLDLPFSDDPRGNVHYLLLQAFHHRPVAGCYNSFPAPTQAAIFALATGLPDARAADALYALGFRAVVLHEELLSPAQLPHYRRALSGLPSAGTHLVRVGEASDHVMYRFASPRRVETGFTALTTIVSLPESLDAGTRAVTLRLTIRNDTTALYRHPDPIEPSTLLVRWHAQSGAVAAEHRFATLMPLALAPGGERRRSTSIPVPAVSGDYEVTLASVSTPEVVLATTAVHVRPPR